MIKVYDQKKLTARQYLLADLTDISRMVTTEDNSARELDATLSTLLSGSTIGEDKKLRPYYERIHSALVNALTELNTCTSLAQKLEVMMDVDE